MKDTRQDESEAVFSTAAELFGLLSTPIRLRILSSLCHGEKNVSQLLAEIPTTQPNMSQHLSTLYRAGVLGKRRDATQIYTAVRAAGWDVPRQARRPSRGPNKRPDLAAVRAFRS